MSWLEMASKLTSFGAGWVLALLGLASVAAVAVTIERSVVFWLSRDDVPKLSEQVAALLARGQVVAARHRLQESPSFEARVAVAALDARDGDGAREKLAGARRFAQLELEQHLVFLGTLGNNAPFIGLLGTVIGIIRAFRELDGAEGRISQGLMNEVGEALVATAVGLLVALPAVIAFNTFNRMVRARMTRAEALGAEVLAHVGRAPSEET